MIGKQLSELVQKEELETLIEKFDIPGISAAYINGSDISHLEAGISDSGSTVTAESVFRAASLSKPVFAYIVLKLAQEGKIHLDQNLDEMFNTAINRGQKVSKPWSDHVLEGVQGITPRMILFHRTGLPITANEDKILKENEALNFEFEPGTQYGYSGIAIQCLQEAIEAYTDNTLEALAQEYVFTPCEMNNSRFDRVAANSLQTTASDYALFMQHWMNDESVKHAFDFDPNFTMQRDLWATRLEEIKNDEIEQKIIENETLNNIAWGLGIGLQRNSDGSVTAFHSGDSTHCRALMAFNLSTKTGIVFLANSDNGLALADKLTSQTVPLEDGLNYLYRKYGFEHDFKEGWQERERSRFENIGCAFPPNKPRSEISTSSRTPRSLPLLSSFSPSASRSSDIVSKIEQLLIRADNMGLDPQKLLRIEGIDIEQMDNFSELQRLAQYGNEMAHDLYKIAAENIQNRSKLASKHLEAAQDPFQTKNTKDK